MMNKKRLFAVIAGLALSVSLFAGCTSGGGASNAVSTTEETAVENTDSSETVTEENETETEVEDMEVSDEYSAEMEEGEAGELM